MNGLIALNEGYRKHVQREMRLAGLASLTRRMFVPQLVRSMYQSSVFERILNSEKVWRMMRRSS